MCLGNLTFHKTIRNKRLKYSFQEKDMNLLIKKVQNRQSIFYFFNIILNNENLLKNRVHL